MQVPGSTLGPELAALLDNSEGADINFKVCHKIFSCYRRTPDA